MNDDAPMGTRHRGGLPPLDRWSPNHGLLAAGSVPARDRGGERGMVAVETAFAVLVLAAIGAFVIAVAGVMFLQAQCQITADEVARQLARGDSLAAERARADAPAGVQVITSQEGGVLVAEVTLDTRLGTLSWPLRAQARVLVER